MKALSTLLWVVAAGLGLGCQRAPLPVGTAQLTPGKAMTVAAATYGDDFVQLMAAADCSEFVAFRNFPSWQFDSCETCFGNPIGSGILSSTGELCGYAFGKDWVSVGDCGAALTVESSTSDELSGTLRIERSSGGPLTLEFRTARAALREAPGASTSATLCDGTLDDRLAPAVCCNWAQDEACSRALFEGSCRN